MPCNDCPLEQALVKTKSSKSSKKEKKCCPSVCETECCLPDCNPDCCTPAYQRLDKLRTIWVTSDILAMGTPGTLSAAGNNSVFTRAGVNPVPPSSVGGSTAAVPLTGSNTLIAYNFVSVERYVNFEACGKADQVLGWWVDTTTGNLELFQDLPELNLYQTDNRAYLDSLSSTTITTVLKQKLYQMNVLYKLTLSAIERVGGNPKTEGNICEFTDKCGQKWLVLINRSIGPSPISVATVNNQWVVVAVRLC
jgi:hypothetical protein